MPENTFEQITNRVLKILEGLSPDLTYHCIRHTLDVVRESQNIAKEEGITDERELYLLKIAALYHDTGFLKIYTGHEAASVDIFMADAADLHLTEPEKETIKGLIMATRVPQEPHTLLEKIICDADLDYLGRPDFLPIGDGLRKEFIHYGIVKDDAAWDQLQLKFLGAHRYHTASSQRRREPIKQANYRQLL